MNNPYTMPLDELRRAAVEPKPTAAPPPNELQQLKQSFEVFRKDNPTFSPTEENIQRVLGYHDWSRGVPQQQDWLRATAMAAYDGQLAPAPADPVITDPNTMPLIELGRVVEGRPQRLDPNDAHNIPMERLTELVFGPRGEADPAYTMPLDDLKTAMQEGETTDGNQG